MTWTLSVTWPTSNFKSAVTCAWVATASPLRSNFLNPGASHTTEYVAGNYLVENVFAVATGGRAPLFTGSFVHKRDFSAHYDALVLVDDQTSNHSVVGLSEQRRISKTYREERGSRDPYKLSQLSYLGNQQHRLNPFHFT